MQFLASFVLSGAGAPTPGIPLSPSRPSADSARRGIRDRFGVAILLIEHDMALVMNVCQRIQVIDYGQTIAAGLP